MTRLLLLIPSSAESALQHLVRNGEREQATDIADVVRIGVNGIAYGVYRAGDVARDAVMTLYHGPKLDSPFVGIQPEGVEVLELADGAQPAHAAATRLQALAPERDELRDALTQHFANNGSDPTGLLTLWLERLTAKGDSVS